ncbi:MAG TPA: hypothetical protein VNE18_11810 [Rhodanobacter sp.]|nr:hypothetical protein [Rhodanobacter sp.]
MELDELKMAWREQDRRLERSEALQSSLRRELSIDRMRSALRSWLWLPGIELAISLLTAWLIGGFLADNWTQVLSTPAGAVPALVLFMLAVVSAAASARQIVSVATVDYAASVLSIQRRLAMARALRIRLTQLGLLLWLPLWPMFMVFIVQYGLGFGVYRQFDLAWLVSNVVLGLALALVLVWLTRRYGNVLGRWRPLHKLSDSIAGRKLASAVAQMDEFARFERE